MILSARTASFLLFALSLTACGGGGGGGTPPVQPPSGDTLSGQITIPNLAAGGGGFVERRSNDEAHSAESAGTLRVGGALELAGTVDPDRDRQDVLRVTAGGTLHAEIRVTADHPVTCHVFEIGSGREVLRLGAGEQLGFDVRVDAFDIVIAARDRASRYTVMLAARSDVVGAHRVLPISDATPALGSATQARYLGAHHPMRPGEIVVLRTTDAPKTAVALPGCERVRGGAGPIEVYRMLGPWTARSVAKGAQLGQSLELDTALAAKRATTIPGVRAASANYVYRTLTEPDDQHYKHQWHYRQIKLPQAWDVTTGSTNVIVGVLDTGVVLAHPDLQGRLIAGFDMISDPANALDGDGRDANPDDPGSGGGTVPSSFHGTHVAGTIGARSNNQLGVAGVDWNCKIMPLRALGKGGRGSLDDIANGILYAARLPNASGTLPPKRVDVLNMSLGSPSSTPVMQNACDSASAAGVLLIAASGNDNSPTVHYPAGYASVVSVGATDAVGGRAPYSNYATNIDIWGPGGNQGVDLDGDGYGDGVLSSVATGFGNSRQPAYEFSQGTSMACPHIAGVTALLLSVKPGITLPQLRGILTVSSQAGKNLPNGGVLVDAYAAVLDAKGQGPTTPVLVATPSVLNFQPGETQATVTLANRGVGNLKYDMNKSNITYVQQVGQWISNANLSAPGANIDFTKLAITVDRTGLADGDYTAQATLFFADGPTEVSTRIAINLRVGKKSPKDETLFVLLIDIDSLDTRFQASTTALENYKFALPNVTKGAYLLVAGTDRDNDDILGDEGELFGVWPSEDSPEIVSVEGVGATVQNLNFGLGEVVALATGKVRRTYRKLAAPGAR